MTFSPTDLAPRLQEALGAQYTLGPELGRGGMGVVFSAHDHALDRPVAVKVIHPDLAANPAIARRFLAEARMIARLRHPNIVAVHTAGQTGELLYYVMDHVPGESLRQRLQREGRLDHETAQRIGADLAGALDAAGRAGLVHRDVKPENILLEEGTDRALLVDFGIARALEGDKPEITGQGVVVGTPVYMSPEQAAGEEVDARSDLYALGIVLFEMVAGQPPFVGPNRIVVSKQISEQPPLLTALRPECPEPLAGAVHRALAKAPDDRWQSGRELQQALTGGTVTPLPTRRRRRRLAGAAALALLALAASLGYAALRPGGPPEGVNPRHSILVLPFDNVRQRVDLDWLRDGSVSMLALNLSQWSDLSVVDAGRVHDLVARHRSTMDDGIGLSLARRLAREAGAWTVVLGDFAQSGDSLLLSARVFDVASGTRVDVAQVAGPAGRDVRGLFDALAARLLNISGAPDDVQATLAQATTQSLEAYRAFLRGSQRLNGWDLAAARRDFEAAVALDTTFGLAYYRLALTRGWLYGADDPVSLAAMVRATNYSTNLPHHEKVIINAYRAFLDGDFTGARSFYQQLIARDSTDADAWYGLGDAWFHDTGEPAPARWTKSIRAFRRTLALDASYALAYEHLTGMLHLASSPQFGLALVARDSFAASEGRDGRRLLDSAALAAATARASAEAVAAARSWVAAQPSTGRASSALVDAYLGRRSFPLAMTEVNRFRATPTPHPEVPFVEARVRFASGEIERATQGLRRAVDSAVPRDFGATDGSARVLMNVTSAANVFAYQGDIASAVRTFELADQVRQTLDLPKYGHDADGTGWLRERLGHLYASVGAPAASLRRIWEGAAEAGRSAPTSDRAAVVRTGAAAALGLYMYTGDSTALKEFQAMSGDPLPREVLAHMALERKDSALARRLLTGPPDLAGDKMEGPLAYWAYRKPLAAGVYFHLKDYDRAVELLKDYEPEFFETGHFDVRWGLLGRVRLLRAQSYLKLGRNAEAERELRQVLAQYERADPALEPLVQEARRTLASVVGTG